MQRAKCERSRWGIVRSNENGYHTFVEIDHEIISTVILLPSTESFNKGCQLQEKVCARSTAILSAFIKLPFIVKTFVLFIFEWQF